VGDFLSGMDRFAARTKLWEDLEKSGLAIKAEPYTLRVPRSQRGGEVGHYTNSLYLELVIYALWKLKLEQLSSVIEENY
jgi:valyl-tRNA synthetase